MGYQIPTTEELEQYADTLVNAYREKKKVSGKAENPDRLNFLAVLKNLVEQPQLLIEENRQHILMGAYVFMLEHIGNEKKYRILHRDPRGSVLYDLINTGLRNSNENILKDENKLVYLSAFYKFMKSNASPETTLGTTWASNSVLLSLISDELAMLVYKQFQQILFILGGRPTFKRLRENLAHMYDRYETRCQNKTGFFTLFSSKGEYVWLAKFIDLVNENYCELPSLQVDETLPQYELQYTIPYMLRMGVATFALQTIAPKYHLRDPNNGSSLHCMVAEDVNVKSYLQLEVDERNTWLNLLATHITSMLNHEDFMKEQLEKNPNIKTELLSIQKQIREIVQSNIAKKDEKSALEQNSALAFSNIAQIGMNAGFKNAVGNNVIPSVATAAGYFVDGIAGAAGFIVAGPGGSAIASTLTHIVRKQLASLAAAVLFAWVLDKIGNRIGYLATGIIKAPFSLTYSGLQSFIEWYKSVETDKELLKENTEWMNALMSLPPEIFDEPSKATLERLGFVEKLTEPVTVSSPEPSPAQAITLSA